MKDGDAERRTGRRGKERRPGKGKRGKENGTGENEKGEKEEGEKEGGETGGGKENGESRRWKGEGGKRNGERRRRRRRTRRNLDVLSCGGGGGGCVIFFCSFWLSLTLCFLFAILVGATVLCIKMVFQSWNWNGDMRMQCRRTLVSPSPTCSRMLHACFCHIYVYGERHSSSSSERCLMRFSSKLSWCQSFLSLTIPAERFLFLPLR